MAKSNTGRNTGRNKGRDGKNNGLAIEQIEELARRHARRALVALAEVVGNGEATPATRISAATAILQWGFGRPGSKGKPVEPGEQVIRLSWGEE